MRSGTRVGHGIRMFFQEAAEEKEKHADYSLQVTGRFVAPMTGFCTRAHAGRAYCR